MTKFLKYNGAKNNMASAVQHHSDIYDLCQEIGKNAKQASHIIRLASTESKNQALRIAAEQIITGQAHILEENAKDIALAKQKNLSPAMIDRLLLDEKRIKAIAQSLLLIADLPDPVGKILAQWQRPNGLDITRIATPLGVIGIIYESRPNVTADAGALAMKAGNAVILRGGSESQFSSKAIHDCLLMGLKSAHLPETVIQLMSTNDRAAVGHMLADMADYIDIIIPRGGKSLVARVQSEARVPVLAHLEGICHSYVHQDADPQKAIDIVVNAKMRRTGVCGATETLLIDKEFDTKQTVALLDALDKAGCEIRGCDKVQALWNKALPATEEDWHTEYLASIVSVKIVENVAEALSHIRTYSSNHTEAIITENKDVAEQFLSELDSAILLHNASTQFADGGEFGMGAEIGIATGKIHARGPVGLEQLTCFKYQLRGNGQVRPV